MKRSIEAIKNNCNDIYHDCQNNYDKINKEIIEPIKTLLKSHKSTRNKLESQKLQINSSLEKKRNELDNIKTKYLESFKKFNEDMEDYMNKYENQSESKLVKIVQKIITDNT